MSVTSILGKIMFGIVWSIRFILKGKEYVLLLSVIIGSVFARVESRCECKYLALLFCSGGRID